MNNSETKRGELLDKISALLEKTVTNGCTEAEALTAASLAEKLMAKYGLNLADLKAIDPITGCSQEYVELGQKRTHEVQYMAGSIAAFTETKTWYRRQHCDPKTGAPSVGVMFLGLAADVQIAIYLFKTIRVAIDTEWKRYWSSHSGNGVNARTARKNFTLGMTERLWDRLDEMREARIAKAVNDCREIVLAKDRLIAEAFKNTGIKLGSNRTRNYYLPDDHSYLAGQKAGDRTSLSAGELK